MVRYRTLGIILKKIEQREADRVFVIYTKDFGKLKILGRAIRKIKSKLRGGAELFYLSEIEFIQGKIYKTLTDAVLINNFSNMRSDLERLKIAYQVSEVLDKLVKGQEFDENIWQLLNEIFERLNNDNLNPKTQILTYYYFLWNFFSVLGYCPELYECFSCRKKLIIERFYLEPEQGGVICVNCFGKINLVINQQNLILDKAKNKEAKLEIVKILRIILKKDWLTLNRLKIDLVSRKFLKDVSQKYFNYILNEVN